MSLRSLTLPWQQMAVPLADTQSGSSSANGHLDSEQQNLVHASLLYTVVYTAKPLFGQWTISLGDTKSHAFFTSMFSPTL